MLPLTGVGLFSMESIPRQRKLVRRHLVRREYNPAKTSFLVKRFKTASTTIKVKLMPSNRGSAGVNLLVLQLSQLAIQASVIRLT